VLSADQRLTKFIKEGKDWERKATSIPGIFLLRLPGLRSTVQRIIEREKKLKAKSNTGFYDDM
jgi:hypothetical protein